VIPQQLDETEAHVWYLFPDALSDDALHQARLLMNEEERARHDRFVFPEGRREFAFTRALARTTLSRYADVAPKDWRFSFGPHGRPEIASSTDLYFNLSNTKGLITCIVGRTPEVGIDVESIERNGETLGIADRFFSPSEATSLRSLPAGDQHHRFFHLWTLKEAYIKARGMGLALPLDQFSFHIAEGVRTRISFDPRLVDEPSTWQFDSFWPSPSHFVATAVRRATTVPREKLVRIVERTVTLFTAR
jgi:4'-phosphopantetheinyl transferase